MATLNASIHSKTARARLQPRREPYWFPMSVGCALGYRKLAEGEGTWIAKYRDPQTKARPTNSLGTILDEGSTPAFDIARKRAQAWFDELAKGVESKPLTVRQACERYAKSTGADGTNRRIRAEADFRRLIYSDTIGDIELAKLRSKHLDDWRTRMSTAPARVGRGARIKVAARAPATVNRDIVSLRAALNRAHEDGYVASDVAWRKALKPIRNADRRREGVMDLAERRKLIEAAARRVQPFLKALALLPIRPGAIAALTADDFDARHATLRIRLDKGHPVRTIALPPATAEFFATQRMDKLPSAPLFHDADGRPWTRHTWKKPIAAAAESAGLPDGTTAYTMRHSVITELVVENRIDLLTIAQISGTSILMIEKHYGHHRRENAARGLAMLSL